MSNLLAYCTNQDRQADCIFVSETGKFTKLTSGKHLHQVQEEGSDDDSDGLGPDGWDDVLSAWMSNAGLLDSNQAREEDQATQRRDPSLICSVNACHTACMMSKKTDCTMHMRGLYTTDLSVLEIFCLNKRPLSRLTGRSSCQKQIRCSFFGRSLTPCFCLQLC